MEVLKKIIIPTDFSEITLKQFSAYIENPTDIKRKIGIFLNLDMDFIDTIDDDDINDINKELDILLISESKFYPSIKVDDINYYIIPNFNDISFGEYVDICTYVNEMTNLHKLMAILFRPLNKKNKLKKYKGTKDICDKFMELPMSQANGAVFLLKQFLVDMHDAYPEIYNGGTSEGEAAINYFSKWGWYATIKALSKNKVYKINTVLDLNVHEIHNYLAADIDEKKFRHSLLKGTQENTIQL